MKITTKNKFSSTHAGHGSIRIIGGLWRGRKIPVPHLPELRPTPDRVRETLFNWLAPHIHGTRCLDLFGGSGALGFEALSRGALHATVVEKAPNAISTIRQVACLLQTNALDIVEADTMQWLQNKPSCTFDIVFIDPPFQQQLVTECCVLLDTHGWLSVDALIYVEYARNQVIELPSAWQCHRQQQAGDVAYALYRYKPHT